MCIYAHMRNMIPELDIGIVPSIFVWIGAYRVLEKSSSNSSDLLKPLEYMQLEMNEPYVLKHSF